VLIPADYPYNGERLWDTTTKLKPWFQNDFMCWDLSGIVTKTNTTRFNIFYRENDSRQLVSAPNAWSENTRTAERCDRFSKNFRPAFSFLLIGSGGSVREMNERPEFDMTGIPIEQLRSL
jgi:hypothetical protein